MSSWKSSSVSSGLLMIFLMMPTLSAFYRHTCRRDYAHTSPQGDGREVQREINEGGGEGEGEGGV